MSGLFRFVNSLIGEQGEQFENNESMNDSDWYKVGILVKKLIGKEIDIKKK